MINYFQDAYLMNSVESMQILSQFLDTLKFHEIPHTIVLLQISFIWALD